MPDHPLDALDRGVLDLIRTLDEAAAQLAQLPREDWMAPLYASQPDV